MPRHLRVSLVGASLVALAACDDTMTAPRPSAVAAEAARPETSVAAPSDAAPVLSRADTASASHVVDPALPQALPDLSNAGPTGRIHRPTTFAELQAAARAAQPGDEIRLAPGVRYVGTLVLRRHAPGWVTVRTDGPIPAPGVRATLADTLRFARLVAPGRNQRAVETDSAASGWRLLGLDVTVDSTKTGLSALVQLGATDPKTLEQLPSDIALDRVVVRGRDGYSLTRCILLNSARTWILNSTITECHVKGTDNSGIGGWSGTGPYRIENNDVQGAGMGIFFGGSDPKIKGLTPSDITIRGNHIWRPVSWQGRYTTKNLLEFKHGRRILVEGNVFENHWADAQAGSAILLKSTQQQGRAPWTQVADVTFRHNIVRRSPAGINVAANPGRNSVPLARVKFENNLFYEIGTFAGTRSGRMFTLTGAPHDVQLVHNTMVHNDVATHALIVDRGKENEGQRLVIRNNVVNLGIYGVFASSGGSGESALRSGYGTSWTYSGNLMVGTVSRGVTYPRGNSVVPSLGAVGVANAAAGDFTLSADGALAAAQGVGRVSTPPGVNTATLMRYTRSALSGVAR